MGQRPTHSIVIGSYNEGCYLAWTLKHVARRLSSDSEIIVVDDCSTDSSIEQAADLVESWGVERSGKGPSVLFTRPPSRLGVAVGRNFGASYATGDYLVFLDAHTAPLGDEWIEELVKPLDDDDVGITCPAQIGIPGMRWAHHLRGFPPDPPTIEQVQESYDRGDNVMSYGSGCRLELHDGYLQSKWIEPRTDNEPHRVQIAKGGCLAVRRETFNDWGGFDDGLAWPWGWDDDEISLRAWRMGTSVVSVPRSHVGIVYRTGNSPYGGNGLHMRGLLYSELRTALRLFSWERFEYLVAQVATWSTLPGIVTELMSDGTLDSRDAIDAASPIEDLDHIWDEFGDWKD